MNFDFWEEHLDEFLELLREQEYHPVVVKRHRSMAKRLIQNSSNGTWRSYDDARAYYSGMETLSEKNRWFYLSIINKMEAYHIHGIVPEHRLDKNHMPDADKSLGSLDLVCLLPRIDGFISCYEKLGYCERNVTVARRILQRVIALSTTIEWNSYQDIRDWFGRQELSARYLHKIICLVSQLESWTEYGEIPPTVTERKYHPPKGRRERTFPESLGKLDFTYAKEHMDEFLACLEEEQYARASVDEMRRVISRIIMLSGSVEWDSIQDVREWYGSQNLSKYRVQQVLCTLDKYEYWLEHGTVPPHGRIQFKLSYSEPSIGTLDMDHLREHLDELISYMEDHGYCRNAVSKLRFVASRIIVLSRKIEWNSYQDIWEWYLGNGHRGGYLHDIRAILGTLENFHLHGIFPGNREAQSSLCPRENSYSKLNPEYRALVDTGCAAEEKRGLSHDSVLMRHSKISPFLYHLQMSGEDTLEKVTEGGVVSYFYKDGVQLRGSNTASAVALFLRDAMEYAPDDCRRIVSYVPKIRRTRNNIQYLTDDEGSAFCSALESPDNGLSYKHRAIGTILYYTGMRSSDVGALTLDAVDLRHSVIRFVQKKTGNPVELPLPTVVGNAIYDYCTYERPETDSPYLFVTDQAPHRGLIKGAVQWAVVKVMKAAGIRQNKGDRQGGHIFRHRAVSKMAENNVPAPVISATVGHVNPKSLDSYLYADMKHIRECAISLDGYLMDEEVFSHV